MRALRLPYLLSPLGNVRFNCGVSKPFYDALVIGGGPAGSTVATLLARAGKKVCLLEKETFPRFHIGESLLPYNRRIFAELGVLPQLEAAGLIKKLGAQFHMGNGAHSVKFVFAEGPLTREPQAFQVERASFDHLLLRHSAANGAEVREGWTVKKFAADARGVALEARDPAGQLQELKGAYLADASGRGNLTGNQEQLRVVHPKLKKVAVFAHYSGVRLDPGAAGGDTVIVRQENKWFWVIPLSPGKTSVGAVMDQAEFGQLQASPEKVLAQLFRDTPVMRDRMQSAVPVSDFHSTGDFSYYNRRLVGPRLLRVGDAAGFMDPIFSAGVYLAMFSGKAAAETILRLLSGAQTEQSALRQYEKKVNRAMRFYWELVENYYTTPFMEVFMAPREKWNLPAAVNAVLAGELEGGWELRWRMRLFYWIVKLQRHVPLLPRLTFMV